MTLNELVTPIFKRYGLVVELYWAHKTQKERFPWYTAEDDEGSWVATVHEDFIDIRNTHEDYAVITSHRLMAGDPNFLETLEDNLKTITKWLGV